VGRVVAASENPPHTAGVCGGTGFVGDVLSQRTETSLPYERASRWFLNSHLAPAIHFGPAGRSWLAAQLPAVCGLPALLPPLRGCLSQVLG